ncbi:MAG TPA: hypothetical protein VM658_17645 [bacterium]|nr:hypothetical protein [bacterium]
MTIEHRLEKLEKENRMLKRLFVLAMVGLVVWLIVYPDKSLKAESSSKVIEATAFHLVDSSGKTRGLFNVSSAGLVQIGLFDGKKKPRTLLAVSSNGDSSLIFSNSKGQESIELSLSSDNTSSFVFFDTKNKSRLLFGVAPSGTTGMGIKDSYGNIIWSAP